jgi:hypothetical protein
METSRSIDVRKELFKVIYRKKQETINGANYKHIKGAANNFHNLALLISPNIALDCME